MLQDTQEIVSTQNLTDIPRSINSRQSGQSFKLHCSSATKGLESMSSLEGTNCFSYILAVAVLSTVLGLFILVAGAAFFYWRIRAKTQRRFSKHGGMVNIGRARMSMNKDNNNVRIAWLGQIHNLIFWSNLTFQVQILQCVCVDLRLQNKFSATILFGLLLLE